MNEIVVHDQENKEFRIEVAQNEWAKVTYRLAGTVIYIEHSSVPSSLRGQGKGGVMMEAVLPQIEVNKWKIVAECSYVKHYLDRHDRWNHLIYQD